MTPGGEDRALRPGTLAWALAIFFVIWSLRAGPSNVVDSDAARHAMNGAFLHDLIRDGAWLHPIEYGRSYYGRLPALSLPFHPPLFPLIEAAAFAAFGVSAWTARVTVALAAGISALLLYRLILRTSRSHLVAGCSVATFLLWWVSQVVAGDVMLEFPSMVFVAAALNCLEGMESRLGAKQAAAFGLFAAAAVWTKQHTVFLALVPFIYYVLGRRFRMLFQPTLLAASAGLGIAVIGVMRLSAPFKGTGVDQVVPREELVEIALRNAKYYLVSAYELLGPGPVLLLGCVMVGAAWLRPERRASRPMTIYWAWILSVCLVLLVLGALSPRYLFYVYPAAIAVVYTSLLDFGKLMAGARAWIAPSLAMAACAAAGAVVTAPYLSGPAEAARLVLAEHPRRILYCGSTDGSFIFAVRSLDAALATTVIPGDKLSPEQLAPHAFAAFAEQYGIQYVVLERAGFRQQHDGLHDAPVPQMTLVKRIPLASSQARWNGGYLSVYRMTGGDSVRREDLKLSIPRIGGEVPVQF